MQAYQHHESYCDHQIAACFPDQVTDEVTHFTEDQGPVNSLIQHQCIMSRKQNVLYDQSQSTDSNKNGSIAKKLSNGNRSNLTKGNSSSLQNPVLLPFLPPQDQEKTWLAQKLSHIIPPKNDTERPDNHNSSASKEIPMTEAGGRKYACNRYIGCGSFGVVFQARNLTTGEQVAIKKVDQDPRYKNRELDIMKELIHPNIIQLRDYFYEEFRREDSNDIRRKLNVVMDFIPDTIHRVSKTFSKYNQLVPMILVRLYTYQLCRSVGFLHSLNICHRDIKPQNLLVEAKTQVLKLCDFGSAKRLVKSEHSVAYICSRFYRAPELMLGATEYTTAIDLWSIGCVLGELLIGRPLFSGESAVDQLVKIIRVLGTPTKAQMQAMNPNYEQFKFPDVQPVPWKDALRDNSGATLNLEDDVISLLESFLKYEPDARLKAYKALLHPFFDPLRRSGCKLCDDMPLPDLFNFTPEEKLLFTPEELSRLIPAWYTNPSRIDDSEVG